MNKVELSVDFGTRYFAVFNFNISWWSVILGVCNLSEQFGCEKQTVPRLIIFVDFLRIDTLMMHSANQERIKLHLNLIDWLFSLKSTLLGPLPLGHGEANLPRWHRHVRAEVATRVTILRFLFERSLTIHPKMYKSLGVSYLKTQTLLCTFVI